MTTSPCIVWIACGPPGMLFRRREVVHGTALAPFSLKKFGAMLFGSVRSLASRRLEDDRKLQKARPCSFPQFVRYGFFPLTKRASDSKKLDDDYADARKTKFSADVSMMKW